MQFEPEIYPVKDYNFCATSTLGIIAREYETTQLVQLLQTMSPESPAYPILIESIVENMNLANRDQIIQTLRQAQQPPSPEEQQAMQQQQQAAQQAQIDFQNAQTALLNAQAQEAASRAQKYGAETQAIPMELEVAKIKAITTNLDSGQQDDKEFERRLKIAELAIKEKKIDADVSKSNAEVRLKQMLGGGLNG